MSGMLSQVIQRDSKLETELVVIDENNINAEAENAIKRAGEVIRRGGLVAFPTETVYGLGGDALNPESSKKIYAAKGRPSDNPLIVHIADIKDLELITDGVSEAALKLAKAYWPGPLTMQCMLHVDSIQTKRRYIFKVKMNISLLSHGF